MDEKIETKEEEVVEETAETTDVESTETTEDSDSSSTEEVDYEALAGANEAVALAEKERADAAEALIVKNKKIASRHKDTDGEDVDEEDKPITRKELEEVLSTFNPRQEEESEEAKRLIEAQNKVKELTSKKDELARALKSKDTVRSDIASTHMDGEKPIEPKLAANSPLKSYKHVSNGVYSKELPNGTKLFVNTKATGNERKKWTE